MTRNEIARSVDVFTIELIDMQKHHRVLFGDDAIKGLAIPANLHRVQVEYELREKLALLRQHVVLALGSDSRLWDLLLRSVSSFATLFRHALIVLKHKAQQESARQCRSWRNNSALTLLPFCKCWMCEKRKLSVRSSIWET